ncbi:hypothetical protein HUX88_22875 [Duganella sp. BJB1802]|uniref:hypothetical protein n=1 Tax=Duganella sp. BJB1802 TaxID=2744575 RepID=UPI001594C271|nr:hypothetical protein [Duganella sp. BJB1802]NVD73358.1 hypothetical protein [Duganella sp. BJB1802]
MAESKIYRIQVSNDYAVLAPLNQKVTDVVPIFNSRPLWNEWVSLNYEFQIVQRGKITKIPDISIVVGAGLAFRQALKDEIFPFYSDMFEFLPIQVAGESWFVLNCLSTTLAYDSHESIFYRSIEGQIFLINYLIVNDASLLAREIFVIDDSNRSNIFVFPSFMDRVNNLGLKGVTFKEMGFLRAN